MINFKQKIKYFKKINLSRGMTYIELIVVLIIFAIMSSIIIFDYSRFGRKVNLENLTQDVALQIATAQKKALSGTSPSIDMVSFWGLDLSSWRPSYGVYFDTAKNNQFINYVDMDSDEGLFNPDCSTTPTECIDTIKIENGTTINKICFYLDISPNTETCPDVSLQKLSVNFTRPNSAAALTGPVEAVGEIIRARIEFMSANRAHTQSVIIHPSGRIEVI